MAVEDFVTGYSYLIGPGDHIQSDYTTPTPVRSWQKTTAVQLTDNDKQIAYGQWIAQLLQNQIGVPLLGLYRSNDTNEEQWPIQLRSDVIAALNDYFDAKSQGTA